MPGLETPYEHARRLKRSTYYGALTRLEGRGLIEKKKKKNRIVYVPTDKGMKYRIPGRIPVPQRRKDGLSTVVIFDVPETMKRQREAFRRYLIRNKFTLLQKSVFISPNKIDREIKEIIDELKISQFVTLLSARIGRFF